MDLRDRFALEIVKTMLATEKTAGDLQPEDAASDAYLFADALMAARGEVPTAGAPETETTATDAQRAKKVKDDIAEIMGLELGGEAGA